jgi:hypothetical protein
MPIPVDTDYTAYVVTGYAIGGVALIGMFVWTVLRLVAAQHKLEQAEKDDAP